MRNLSNRFSNRLSNRFNNRVSSSPGNSFGSFKLLPWLGALTGAVILTACSPQSSQTDQPFHAGSVVNRNTDSQPAGNQGTPATGQDQDQAGRLPQPKPSADNANTSPAQLSLGEKQAVLVKNFSHIGALRGRDTEAIGLASVRGALPFPLQADDLHAKGFSKGGDQRSDGSHPGDAEDFAAEFRDGVVEAREVG